jgi:curved DNA-binding protein
MKEKGGPGRNGGPNGDLFITIHIQKQPRFERRDDDLYFDQPLDAFTAILGGKINVETIDKTIKLNIPAGTDSNKVFRLKEMGMPNYNDPARRGDGYVRIIITVPKNLSEQDKEALALIAKGK